MRKILLIGKDGQIGWELQRTLAPLGRMIAPDRKDLDLLDPRPVRTAIRKIRPELIINAAAYTAVDKAEAEPDLAMQINGVAPGILAEEARDLGAVIVHYSTDYIFDGTKQIPYVEDDIPNPLNAYGRSKLSGEMAVRNSGAAHLIFRTGWVYGMRGHNFLLTMLRLAKEREELRVVCDQIGAPTWSRMIAEATSLILSRCHSSQTFEGKCGTYHLTAHGSTSWHDFAKTILENTHLARRPNLTAIPTEAYPLPATRPKSTILSNAKLQSAFGLSLPCWSASLSQCISDMNLCCSRENQ